MLIPSLGISTEFLINFKLFVVEPLAAARTECNT